jgi:hypothetical protein
MNWPRNVKPTVMFGFGLSGFRFGWVGWGVFVSFAASGLVTVTRGRGVHQPVLPAQLADPRNVRLGARRERSEGGEHLVEVVRRGGPTPGGRTAVE